MCSLAKVTDLCEGGDLAGYYPQRAFTKAEFGRVLGEVLGGLTYLHHRGVAHKDLRAENVRRPALI